MHAIGKRLTTTHCILAALAALWLLNLAWAGHVGLVVADLGTLLATLLLLAANLLLYRRLRGGAPAYDLAWSVAVFVALGTGFTLLSYLGLTLHMPLADRWLAACDQRLGFDWLAWHRFVRDHALFNTILLFAYRSLAPQMVITLFALPLSGMLQRNREFLWATAFALLATVAISALLPAESAWVWYHTAEPIAPAPWHDFTAMRDGHLAVLDLQQLRGLVTFPSFHVAMAVMLVRAAQGTRFALFSLVLNLLMIVSTPSEGGHYLVDAIGGITVAITAIIAARLVVRSDAARTAATAAISIAQTG
jgi:membrane-associated phospholipid phosphatase